MRFWTAAREATEAQRAGAPTDNDVSPRGGGTGEGGGFGGWRGWQQTVDDSGVSDASP